ncbi:uncharacterized protein Z520_05941 [Fonsecaea multimorphosa CBS 102226]|uniref:Saccharopine dehydrogenase NADP binding domain-containing protein n=1 Tax=Fonsecaea multimorphosa CBS 102226 TaxID=1442371 RepID=A0A0D2H9S8_9EURO|nr:uncharacterized protein Z520_05941 [Fonsecaea multimorphosa CBS 102226]KIX98640.1 hypothetical protein Z520_05941 [Fonsecaea multimorphosa CBS 102226]OAL24829.1 hypothetical protein AYO22_05618 [Fonsecaea multimorphosa]
MIQSSKQVVFIGAAGEMCRVAINLFAKASAAPLLLADINETTLERVASELPEGRATTRKLDLFDPTALREIVQGAALVVLGAGPYARTSMPVLEACLEARVPYLDYDDDVESTQAALELNEKAKSLGVPCYLGCGASPGMSNIMVMDAVKGLDTVDNIDLCWWVGDERGAGTGKAVIEHFLHITAGPCLTWENGKPVVHESFVETGYAPLIPGHGETLLHETAHPEPVTLPRLFPNATRIRCLGGVDPVPFQGLGRGLGTAVRTGRIPMSTAVDFIFGLMNEPPSAEGFSAAMGFLKEQYRGGDISVKELLQLGSHAVETVAPWRYGFAGMFDQVREGKVSTLELLSFLINSARGKTVPIRSGLLARVTGTRNGAPVVSMRRIPTTGKDAFLGKSMGAVTGASTAAFMLLAMDPENKKRAGVLCPEDWAEPQSFYEALERIGCPAKDIVESL